MLRTNRISAKEVAQIEDHAVIPLASYGDKLLTVSIGFVYTVHQDGKLIYKSTSASKAIETYNEIPVIKRSLIPA